MGWVSQAGFSSGGGAPGADGDGAAGQAQAGGPGVGRVHIEAGAQGKCPLIPGVCLPGPEILQAAAEATVGPRQAVAAWWTPGPARSCGYGLDRGRRRGGRRLDGEVETTLVWTA